MDIVLIGAGNVAVHLASLIKSKGHKIIQVYNRSAYAKKIASKLNCSFTTNTNAIIHDADLYIIAVPDEKINGLLKKLLFNPSLIVHTSGSNGLDVFPASMSGTGVLYPLQTFSKETKKTPEKIPFCIEGNDNSSLRLIKKFARTLSSQVYELTTEQRRTLHLAAVFVNNFPNHLYSLSETILQSKKIPFELLIPLISETAEKIKHSSPSEMQTGPARRGDEATIQKHLVLLKSFPQIREVYSILTKSIQKDFKARQ